MQRRSPSALPLALALLVAACAGAEDSGDAQPGDVDAATADGLDCYIARGTRSEARERPSPLRRTTITLDGGTGLLCYGAPSARNRVVMGVLVPFGAPWRVGANEPTTLHLSAPANVGGVALDPGSYSLYAIPGEDEWQFFVNSNWERWGIPIDRSVRATEIGSFSATPTPIDEMVETLRYTWEPGEGGTMGDLVLEWERTRVSFHVHPGGD